MNITVKQAINATIYVENIYQDGSLSSDDLEMVESIPWIGWMQQWLNSIATDMQLENCELSLRLTSDRQIQELNCQYRSMDKPTDVLAFAATEADINIPLDCAEPIYLGDLVISLETAVKQAKEQQHSIVVELAWLASHGLLHLLGWDHPDDRSLKQMLKRQLKLIQLLNLHQNERLPVKKRCN